MARRTRAAPAPQPAQLTPEAMRSGIARLKRRIEEVKQFNPQSVTDQYDNPEVDRLSASIDDALIRTFGINTTDYNLYRDAVTFYNGPHNYAYEVPIHLVQQSLSDSKARSIALLEQAVRSLEERLAEEGEAAALIATDAAPTLDLSKVFVVHGHDAAPKAEVAWFIEKLGLDAIILHERPNKGRALITKFREEAAGVGFAVVLMTPDDVGKAEDAADLKARARQNVVFELGFFIGKLGPERVAALVKGDIELPSDYDGVVYISRANVAGPNGRRPLNYAAIRNEQQRRGTGAVRREEIESCARRIAIGQIEMIRHAGAERLAAAYPIGEVSVAVRHGG
jgi:predicted nucleotide-binding protein